METVNVGETEVSIPPEYIAFQRALASGFGLPTLRVTTLRRAIAGLIQGTLPEDIVVQVFHP